VAAVERTFVRAGRIGVAGLCLLLAFASGTACETSPADGAVVGWGPGVPAAVNGRAGTATAIAVGAKYGCAIQSGTGRVVCWGWNHSGQAMPPPSVDGTTGTATAIAAGSAHACAIQAGTGRVICWLAS
jgi:hypothetical protein